MVRASLVLPAICLSASVTAVLQPSWITGDTAASSTVTATPAPAGTTFICSESYRVQDGDTCESIQDRFMTFTLQQFYSWNPSISSGCVGLEPGHFVCVRAWSSSSSSPVSYSTSPNSGPTATTTITVTSTTGGYLPPTGSDTATDCVTEYQAQFGDSCWSLANEKFTYLNQALFTKWNPSVGSACALQAGEFYCVAVKDAQPMPGTIKTCKTWHLVANGDVCWEIEQDYHISAAQFNAWNPRVGSDCSRLWLGYFVCVGA